MMEKKLLTEMTDNYQKLIEKLKIQLKEER